MKIVTWNVNSLRVRLPQVLDWLQAHTPDVLCLQETKLKDEDFPATDFSNIGYTVTYSGQKTYNGVACISRSTATNVRKNLPGSDDPQRRMLAVDVDDIRIVNVYVPNGQEVGADKYQYKLAWLESLTEYLVQELEQRQPLILLGDFNIAPADADVHDPEAWQGKVLCSEPERFAFSKLIDVGLYDSFRKFEQEPGSYSWWDYRAAGFRRNLGLRIDHILCSKLMYDNCAACYIDKEPRKLERPSDHTPVVAEFKK